MARRIVEGVTMSTHSGSFVPDPDWPNIVELAIQRWGQPTERRRDEVRFGTKGSKSVKPSDNTWFDHEANQGGGYIEIHEATIGPLPQREPKPKRKTNGNGHLPPWEDIRETYDYPGTDADGRPIQVVRTISGNPRFRQRTPDTSKKGGWDWHTKHIPDHERRLYRLSDLRNASPDERIWICAGEKDADRLHNAGLTATTNIGGEGKWKPEYANEFRGKRCVVLQDNDDTGIKHTATVAQSLIGIAASVKVLLLPGLPPKGDVSDFLDAAHTLDELERLAKEAPEENLSSTKSARPSDDGECTLAELEAKHFEPIKWIVQDYIPEGLTVFAGRPKIGKSWLMLNVALGVARGTEALGKFVQKGDVLYCGLEDGERRMRSRVEKILGPAIKDWPANFTFRHRLDPIDAGGLDTIEQWLIAHPKRRLVVIDVLGRVRGMKNAREEQYQYDYRLIAALQELATRYSVAIVVVHHVRKTDAEDVLDTVSGTTGIAGAADTVIVLGKTEHGVRFYLRGRDAEEQDKLIEFDPETAIWSVTGDYDEAAPGSMQGLRKQIFDLLDSSPVALTPAQIADRLGAPRPSVRQTLRRMATSQPPQIVRSEQTVGAYEAIR
jgi:hypothetical protein